MFCVSSINVALIQKADVDRFCVLGLRKDPMNRGDWLTFEAQIAQSSTVDSGRALIARTLQHLPTITKNAKVLAQVLGKRFGQRFGDQHGTLLAGAWSLEKNGGGLLDAQTADQWISQMEWTQHETDASDCDEIKCRNAILQQLVRLDGSGDVSIGELVRAVLLRQAIDRTIYKELEPVLARYGLKTIRKGDLMPGSQAEHAGSHYLAIANGSKQLETILRGSPWDNGAYKRALRRIDGVVIPTVGIYFSGVGTQRAVLVPISNDELEQDPET
jgi:putative DNA primase/helicase